MNSINISLSSTSTNYTVTTSPHISNDCSTIVLNLMNVYSGSIPVYLKIDWGDGVTELFDNDIFHNLDVYNSPVVGNKLLTDLYTHVCYPSTTSLYKSFNVQVLIVYNDSNYNLFTIPITIRTYDYFETIYDINLINVNILPTSTNSKEFQLITKKDNSIIEFRG